MWKKKGLEELRKIGARTDRKFRVFRAELLVEVDPLLTRETPPRAYGLGEIWLGNGLFFPGDEH